MEYLSKLIIRLKWMIFPIVVALTTFFSLQFRYLEVDSNIINALPENDSIVSLFKQVGSRFGSNEIGLVIVESDNVFEAEVLNHIDQITDTLSQMEGIVSVTSITNMMNFNVDDDVFEVDNLINRSRWPESKEDADSIRDVITKNEMVTGSLVSKDGNATIILFNFQNDSEIKEVASSVIETIESFNFPEKIYFAGSTFLTSFIGDIISRDMLKLIPISFVLIAIILYLSFYSARGVILPLLTAGMAIIWAIGTFVLMGFKLSMVSNNVPIIILAVGSAYSIHVLNRINQSREKDYEKALITSLKLIMLPVVLTALTTMVGFLSFIFGAYLSMIRDFGVLAALGTFYSAFLSLLFVPSLVSIFPPKKRNTHDFSASDRLPAMNKYFLNPIADLNLKHPKRIFSVWSILVIIGIFGILNLKRSVSVSDYFKDSHPASTADRIMEDEFGGSKPVFAVFKGDIQSPEVLTAMRDFANHLKESPYITSTQSIADVVIKLNRALGGDQDIPEEKSGVQQLWFIIGQQDLSQLITEDLDEALVMAKFKDEGLTNISEFNSYINTFLSQYENEDFTVEVTGMPYVNAQLDRSLVKSQVTSLVIAIILVLALVSLIFKSLKEGLYAAIPIIATISVLYGFMGLTGIPLNIVTVLVASVAMGIGIDYSIHFISHFNHSIDQGNSVDESIKDSITVSGKAIFINFISVSAGFLVLVFSDLMPMVYFGLLIALSMLGSSMGALTLLPATLILAKRKNNSK